MVILLGGFQSLGCSKVTLTVPWDSEFNYEDVDLGNNGDVWVSGGAADFRWDGIWRFVGGSHNW